MSTTYVKYPQSVAGSVAQSVFPLKGPNGSQSAPTYAFTNDSNSGLFLLSTSNLAFSTNSVQRLQISTTAITSTLPINVASLVSGSATSTLSTLSTGTGTLLPGTNWASYTPTFVGLGTVSNVAFFWRRVGDSVQVRGSLTCGTTTAVATTVSLPSGGNTIDTSKMPTDQTALLGTFYRAASSTAIPSTSVGGFPVTAVTGTSTSVVYLSQSTNSATPGFPTALGTAIANSTDRLMMDFSVPVTQFAF